MLAGDAARVELERFLAPTADRRKGIHVRKLVAPTLAGHVAAAMADPKKPWCELAQRLDELPLAKREKVLAAISPELGKELACWWDWSARQPYQRGWERRAYRSPDRSDSLAARWSELRQFLQHAADYPHPVAWQAAWALHLEPYLPLGALFASAIGHGDDEVRRILIASIRGEHATSGPSQHAYVGLLSSPDPAAWAEVERMLVAAQRAEGLRQVILEAADLAHPDAFARILDVVVEHRLARFAGTVRALGVWIGEDLTVRHEKEVAAAVGTMRDFLHEPPAPASLLGHDPVSAFLGIWSLAVRDVRAATAAAELLVGSEDERSRMAAARLLVDFHLPVTAGGLTTAVADTSVAVYAAAVAVWPAHAYQVTAPPVPLTDGVHEELRRRVASLGRVRTVETGLIGSRPVKVGGTLAADILVCNAGDRPLDPDLVAAASADGRWVAARAYAQDPVAHRSALFSLAADRSSTVRGIVGAALQALPTISADEAKLLEETLTRKSADLRTTALGLLHKQQPAALAATVERLSAGTAEQRRAAAELDGAAREAGAPGDALGSLRFGPGDRTPAVRPTPPPAASWQAYHEGFRMAWTSLTAWLSEHADVEVQTHRGVALLANVRWIHKPTDGTLPLPELLGPWWERIQPLLTDGGVELALLAHLGRVPEPWGQAVVRTVVGPVEGRFAAAGSRDALPWQVFWAVAASARRDSWSEPLIRLLETAAAALPTDELAGPPEVLQRRGRTVERTPWGSLANPDARSTFSTLFAGAPGFLDPARLTDDQVGRLWRALRFIDEPEGAMDRWAGPKVEVEIGPFYGPPTGTLMVPDQPYRRWPSPQILAEAVCRGVATRDDLVDSLVLPPTGTAGESSAHRPDALRVLTGLRPADWACQSRVREVVDSVRAAVVDAEVARGDLPTELSDTARGFRTTYGAEALVRCLAALDKRPLARGYAWTASRESSLSHLVRINQPLPDDDAGRLGELAAAAGIGGQRLIETAVYAPQWARIVEAHLAWPGLESAVWWVHAHTKDQDWSVDQEIRAQWSIEVSQRTPLEGSDLVNGAADVAWFHDVIATLGEERFQSVLKAAKYASSAGGHKRAELFASALLGDLTEPEVVERIRGKRHQDSVRALGLLPLTGASSLLERYELLRGFVASDRTSGSQRRASENAAVDVGLENLARTAGFRDPQRLIWAMEAEAVRDLADGAISAADGDVVLTLALDPSGSPELTVTRAGRVLKSVPAKSAKVPEIAELRTRATELRKQIRRMRVSLEAACVLGDSFETDELGGLLRHPILAPMLRELVLVDQEGVLGFPLDATTLGTADGGTQAAHGALRIAHPVDLLASGEWPDLQHVLMVEERRQPFKQLFRELYTLNANERDEQGVSSRRYTGHQVQSRAAGGIFTSRGWVADFEQGFSRTFHQQKITAWCHLLGGWGSPTEVEDATVDAVTFHPAGRWEPMQLSEVPPRVFSETMRDLDLVVSVAHAGGVDPEASESSIEVRGRLVDETAELLGMTNVEVTGHHARVKGKLGTYSVHLGSGVVHRVPGNAVCIVPVSAQHRGRIFLPFADDDPRTAEVISKVILLARDDKINDPTVLQQLVR